MTDQHALVQTIGLPDACRVVSCGKSTLQPQKLFPVSVAADMTGSSRLPTMMKIDIRMKCM